MGCAPSSESSPPRKRRQSKAEQLSKQLLETDMEKAATVKSKFDPNCIPKRSSIRRKSTAEESPTVEESASPSSVVADQDGSDAAAVSPSTSGQFGLRRSVTFSDTKALEDLERKQQLKKRGSLSNSGRDGDKARVTIKRDSTTSLGSSTEGSSSSSPREGPGEAAARSSPPPAEDEIPASPYLPKPTKKTVPPGGGASSENEEDALVGVGPGHVSFTGNGSPQNVANPLEVPQEDTSA